MSKVCQNLFARAHGDAEFFEVGFREERERLEVDLFGGQDREDVGDFELFQEVGQRSRERVGRWSWGRGNGGS